MLRCFQTRGSDLPAIAAAATAATTAATAAATTTTIAATATPVAAAAAATAAITTTAVATATTAITAAAVATTAAATAAESTATAAATTAALLALLGFIDAQRATVEGLAVHALDRLRSLFGGAHGHEREAARAAGLAIGDEVDVAYRAELLEGSANAVGGRVEREISYIQTSVHRLLEPAR
jgi:hypothetical protein